MLFIQVVPAAGYMLPPGAQPLSTTPTYVEDLEDPNPPIDPETANKEFYQLDKVRRRHYTTTQHCDIDLVTCRNVCALCV